MQSKSVFRMRNAFVALLLFLFLANMVFASDAFSAYRSNSGSGTSFPKVRFWNSTGSGSWGSEVELPTAGSPVREAVIKQSPVSRKIVLVTESDDGYIDAYVCPSNCTTASSWVVSNNIGLVWSSAPTPSSRRFDVEFESSTGKALVVYGVNNTNGSKDLAYKILPPNILSFTGIQEQYIDDNTDASDIQYTWVELDRKPVSSSPELILEGFDSNGNDINAWVWNGSAWGNQVEITAQATGSFGYEALAVKYAADGTKAMAVGTDQGNGNVNGQYWNGASWTAANVGDLTGSGGGNGGSTTWMTLKADPATDDLQLVGMDSNSHLSTAYWSGAAWTITSNIDTAIDSSTSRPVDFEWNVTGSKGILVWDTDTTGNTLSNITCAPQCTGAASTITAYAGTGAWLALYKNPTSTDTVRVLGGRINSSAAFGSFSYNGSGYTNYGDTALSANTTNISYEAFTFAFQLNNTAFDFTPPSISLNSPGNATWSNVSIVNFTFTAADDYPGNMSCLLYLDGALNRTNSSTQNNTITNFTVSGISQGSHTWYVNCADNASNTNVSETRTVFVDTLGPAVALDLPVIHFNSSSANMNFTFIPTDNLASNMSCALLIDGSTVATNSSTINNSLARLQALGISEGKHIWIVACNDSANNTGTSAFRNFTVDLTPPAIQQNSPGNNTVQPKSLNLTFTAVDNLSSNMRCALFFDGVYNQTNFSTKNATPTTFQISGLSSGLHNWTVYCNDSANNSASSQTLYFTAAGQPAVSLTYPPSTASLGSSAVNFNFNVTDEVSTYLNCSLFVDGLWNTTNDSTKNATATILSVTGLPQGSHNWSVSCNNSVPLEGSSATWNFTVDTTPPSISLQRPQNISYNITSNIPLNFTVSDNVAIDSCWYKLDGGLSVFGCSNTTFSAGAGGHNMSVYVNDTAGNSNSASVIFTVDTTAPSISLQRPQNKSYNITTGLPLNFTVSDNVAIDSCWYKLNGGPAVSLPGCANTTFSASAGGYNITVYTNDTAGNSNSASVIFTVDTTPPVVSLSSPAPGASIANSTVNFTFTATDNLASFMNCSLYIDGVYNRSNASTANGVVTNFTVTGVTFGFHTWNVTCRDDAGNPGNANRSFTDTAFTTCPVITSSGSYLQMNNLVNAPNGGVCVKITASNVVFDCNGYYITNDGTNNRIGIDVIGPISNVTVKNCAGILNYKNGLVVTDTNNSLYINNSINNSKQDGINVQNSFNTTFTNNTVTDSSQNGIYIGQGGFSTFGYNILLRNKLEGIHIANGDNNLFIGNVIFNSSQDGIQVVQNANNTFINNTVNDNAQHGVHIVQSDINLFINNTMNSNDGPGFLSVSSNNASFINNTACYNKGIGFQFTDSTIEKMINNTFCSNDAAGLDVSGSNATFGGNHYFNNSQDFRLSSPSSSTNITNDIFDAPGDSFQNYTNLSIIDYNTVLAIKWSPPPTSLPSSCPVFSSKFVNISSSTVGMVIDEIAFHYLASDLVGMNLSLFKLARYNGSAWTGVPGQAFDPATNTLTVYNMSDFGVFAVVMCNDSLSALKADQTVLPASPGGTVQFMITINNTGSSTLDSVNVTDVLPSGLTYQSSSIAPYSVVGNTIIWYNITSLAGGSTYALYLNASADAGIVNSTLPVLKLVNNVNVTSLDQIGSNVDANSSANATVYLADISVSKIASPVVVEEGKNITFTIIVRNTGNVTMNVSANDTLPANVTYRGSDVAPTSVVGQAIAWDGFASIAPGASAAIHLIASSNVTGNYTNFVSAIGVPQNGFNVSDDASDNFTVNLTAAETTTGHHDKKMSLSYQPICPGNEVDFSVTSGDRGVSGVEIRVIYDTPPNFFLVGTPTTDPSGNASIVLSQNGSYRIIADRSGYVTVDTMMDFSTCPEAKPECSSDSDCPGNRMCSGGACVPVACSCGQVANHTCQRFECCVDADCTAGKVCVDHACVLRYQCYKDSDCLGTQYCDIAKGAPGGTCQNVTGCGSAVNHKLVPYECGTEQGCPSCPQGEACESHACINLNLTAPSQAYVNETVTVHATKEGSPCSLCIIQVMMPDGSTLKGETDVNGNFLMPLVFHGNYTVKLIEGPLAIQTNVNALPRPETPQPESFPYWALLLLLALILLFLWWMSRKKYRVVVLTKKPAHGKPVEMAVAGSGKKTMPDMPIAVFLKAKSVASGKTDKTGRFSFVPGEKGEYDVHINNRKAPDETIKVTE